ncbi:MAG: pccB [Acidimicrobiaceae bacterium]|nr:MAG: pccB [Acidimicrobiaceae bacterium]
MTDQTPNVMDAKLEDLRNRREQAFHAGSPRSVERQHEKGKMLARERIDYFLDPGSFHELDLLARHRAHAADLEERPYTDGVITGWGNVDGRKVFVFSQDFTVFGGALGEVFAEKIHKMMDLALKVGAPVVGLNDGAGARIQEGVVSLERRGAADLGHPRALRRRRCVQPGDDRLHLHGAREQPHVHHRTRRGEDRHR